MSITRLPKPSLRPFVTRLWAEDQRTLRSTIPGAREHVLPTGCMHLVFRLSGQALRLFDSTADRCGRVVGQAIVGGARSGFYIRDVSTPSCSVGAVLRPGAAEILFGVPASELSERHTPLEDLWASAAGVAHETLLAAHDPEQQLATLESLLASRLPVVRGLHPAVAYALERLETYDAVGAVAKASGYSHRHFIDLFRRAVGLAPKAYCRVMRFQKALQCVSGERAVSWTAVALEAGYSDQAHFNRDFLGFAGVSPTAYRALAPVSPNHVALLPSARWR
jgi:AraC-like DNA-binding protein